MVNDWFSDARSMPLADIGGSMDEGCLAALVTSVVGADSSGANGTITNPGGLCFVG